MAESPAPQLVPLVERAHTRVLPDRGVPPVHVAFYPYVDTRSTVRLDQGRLVLRLSDHLLDAPDMVLEGVVSVLLCRLHRVDMRRADAEAVEAYEAHVRQERLEKRRDDSRRERGRKHIDPVGHHRSLLQSFLRVSLDMDLCLPEVPKLSWSRTVSRRRFGHWDPAHGCIVISRILDDPKVPPFVLDYVVYHELLHIVHPVENGATRRRIHTPAFKADEARFPLAAEAEKWIARLASRRMRRKA